MTDEEQQQQVQPPCENDGEAVAPQSDNEMDTLRKEASEFKDKYLRLLAEMENTRKRLQKDKQESVQYAVQNMMVDFLSPIDHMENALKFTDQASNEVKQWALGFHMILNQFKDVLTQNGVVPFVSVGTPFDHNKHEAIEMIATDSVDPGTVVEEHLKGYRMGDRLIRPARVKVSKALPQEEADQEGQELSEDKE